MNRRFVAVALAVLTTHFFGALSPLYADLSAGLVAYYPFSGNANDASGNGHDGTVYGAYLAADRFGNSNGCYGFAGSDNWIRADLGPSYFSAEFTFSVWAKFDDFVSSYPMIVSGNGSCINWAGMGPAYSPSMQHHIYFYQPSHPYGAGVQLGGMLSPMTLDVHRWYHLCVTRSGPKFAMFVDGVLSSQNTDTNVIQLSGSFLQFGNNLPGIGVDGGDSYFHGNLDDIRIYNRALSASEVVQLHNTENGSSGPWITTQPTGQSAQAGANVTLNVAASGTPTLSYQWCFNGQNIAGATSATLTRTSVTAANSGGYSVLVWNAVGSVVSATAHLAVLTVDTTTQPTLPTYPAQPTVVPGKDSLVFITHGRTTGPDSDDDWVDTMKTSILQVVPANWTVIAYKWIPQSRTTVFDVKAAAEAQGRQAGAYIVALAQNTPNQKWAHVHLIGHSAGAALINEAAKVITGASPTTTIHTTFLDAYTGVQDGGRVEYGQYSQWADSYFAVDSGTGDALLGRTDGRTDGPLVHAYNVDVTWLDPNALSGVNVVYAADSTPAFQVFSSHGWPVQFYQDTITGGLPGAAGYGFPLSKEGGGWNNNPVTHPENNDPVSLPLGGHQYFGQSPIPVRNDSGLQLNLLPNAVSSSGVSFLGNGGASLSSDDPAWLAVGLTITNAANFVQFGAGFTDTNGAVGVLTVYWNTNQIGMVDERAASPGLQTYQFALPGTVTDGLYTLGFKLDAFTNASSITVTNVATGFVGIPQPARLDMLRVGTSNAPVLKLTAASGYNYLVQSSTNLVDWLPTALLVNTNGSVQFADPAVTNSRARFYRAVMP